MGVDNLIPLLLSPSPTSCDNNFMPSTVMSGSIDYQLVKDQLVTILVNETSAAYQVANQIPSSRVLGEEPDGTAPCEEWRRKICQWSFRVVDHFRLDREVVSCGLNIFDRYIASTSASSCSCAPSASCKENKSDLSGVTARSFSSLSSNCRCSSCTPSMDSRTYQLAAMASLYIAIKMRPQDATNEDGARRKRFFKLQSFVELSRGQFCITDICEMERIMLDKLKWKVNPPTPMSLVSYLLCMMPAHDSIPSATRRSYDLVLHVLQELSRYLTELSVCVGGICSSSPASQVAYASILVSMELLTFKALPHQVRNVFNNTISALSHMSGGTILHPYSDGVCKIKTCLQQSLLPEMLVDSDYHKGTSDSCHPISMARDFGLLDLSHIHDFSNGRGSRSNSSNSNSHNHNNHNANNNLVHCQTNSPTSVKRFDDNCHDSPVSVSR